MPTKLEQLQLQFRQRLMQEKEERMIKIHTDSQQKALNKVLRYDSNGPTTSQHQTVLSTSATAMSVRKPVAMTASQAHNTSPAKKSSPGVDRSRPLPPINRNGYSNNRNNNNVSSYFSGETSSTSSSSSSSSSTKVTPVHNNGVRSRSVDADGANRSMIKPSVKVKHGVDTNNHHVLDGSGQQQQHSYQYRTHGSSERKSPDVVKPKQEIHRPKAKAAYETPASSKLSNGQTAASLKSSVEQRTMAGNTSNSKTMSHTSSNDNHFNTTQTSRRTHPKPTVSQSVSLRKPTNGAVRQQPRSRNVAATTSKSTGLAPRKPPNPNQEQCRYCGRNFNKDRIDKHVDICSKTSQKKVKVFDVTKMRVKGTEAESFVKKGISPDPPKTKKTNWKKQHEEFINTIRQAKIAQRHLAAGGKLSDLPPPPPSDTSNYVPCPYCGRKFDEGVAQRHIPKCKNILSNKKAPPTKRK